MTTTSPSPASAPSSDSASEVSFAETALKLGGKSEEESRRTGAIDRAVWERTLPVELFEAAHESTPPDVQQVMSHSLDVVRKHRDAKTLLNAEGKISEPV